MSIKNIELTGIVVLIGMSRREIKVSTGEGECNFFFEVIFWEINLLKL